MTDLLIRDVAPGLKREIEKHAKLSRQSLSAEILRLLKVGLKQDHGRLEAVKTESPLDAMRRAFADCNSSDEEHEEFIRALEEHRKELSPPFRDFE